MTEYQEPKVRSIRLDDDVYEALQKLPISANQFLRRLLSAGGVFETAVDISPRPRKLSKKAAHVAALKASDPLGAEREDIEHGNMELPSSGSVSQLRDLGPSVTRSSAATDTWRSGRKPLLKPSEGKK